MTVQSHRGIVLFIQETMSLYLEAPFLRPVEVRLFRNKSEVCVLSHMLSVFFFYLHAEDVRFLSDPSSRKLSPK